MEQYTTKILRQGFIQKPQFANLRPENEERRATWLELFFDIFFVVAIASVGHILVNDVSMNGFWNFVMTFIPVWWIWIGFTFYNEQFETYGFENRLYTFLLMLPVAGLAIFAHHATHESFVGFVLSYAVARFIIGLLFARAGYYIKSYRLEAIKYSIGFTFTILLTLITAFYIPHPTRNYVFGVVLLIDLLLPIITNWKLGGFKEQRLPLSEKVNERFGLFCIIVIGEIIVNTIAGISENEHPTIASFKLAGLGIALGFFMWWVYFDFVSRRGVDTNHPVKSYVWAYLHMFLVMAFIAIGAGLLHAVANDNILAPNVKMLVGYAVGAALVLIALLESISYRHEEEPMHHFISPVVKIVSGIIAFSLGHMQIGITGLMLLGILVLLLILNAFYGLYSWFTQDENSTYETKYRG